MDMNNTNQMVTPEERYVELQRDSFYEHIEDCLSRYQSGLNEDDTDYLQFSLDHVYSVYHLEAEEFRFHDSEFTLMKIKEMVSSLKLVLPFV